jgi:hypothetical protein
MKTISSRQNALFKRLRTALREHDREIVIEGPKQVADAIAGGWKPIAVVNRHSERSEESGGAAGTSIAPPPHPDPSLTLGMTRW